MARKFISVPVITGQDLNEHKIRDQSLVKLSIKNSSDSTAIKNSSEREDDGM